MTELNVELFKPLTKESYEVLAQFVEPTSVSQAVDNLRSNDGRLRPVLNRLKKRHLVEQAEYEGRDHTGRKQILWVLTLSGKHVLDRETGKDLQSKGHGGKPVEIQLAPYDAGWAYKPPTFEEYLTGASLDPK